MLSLGYDGTCAVCNGTKLVLAAEDQGEVVRKMLAAIGVRGIPGRPVLCFIGAEWRTFGSPFKHGAVLITWPKFLYDLLRKDPEFETSVIHETARHIAQTSPRA